MLDKPYVRYEDEKAFRKAVEKEAKASVSDPDWSDLSQGRYEPFDAVDFTEMVNILRKSSAQKSKSTPEKKARGYRLAHIQRTAFEAREMVEGLRIQLFDDKLPPFPENAMAAAEWIEAQVKPLETMRIKLDATVPAADASITSLMVLSHLLDQHLPDNLAIPEDPQAFGQFLGRCDFINDISFGQPAPLAYLGWLNPQEEMGIKRVSAPDGTLLGQLREASENLAGAAHWEPYAAVHHLLTGGIISPTAIQATTRYRIGQEVFGDTRNVTLEISDPASVTQHDLLTAFGEERSRIAPPWKGLNRRRSRTSPRSERVAAFVEETPRMSWTKRLTQWNRRNPNEQFRTDSAMKKAHSRARIR
jgi:hypothetical protein